MTPTTRPKVAHRSIRRHIAVAALAAGVLLAGFGGWAGTTELSGAILASGRVVVDANIKQVQHPLGGIVSSIEVRNGQRVQEGEVLLTLDPTIAGANLAVVTKALDALMVKQRRLEAERDQLETFTLPAELMGRMSESGLAALLETETRFFNSRASAREGLKAQLEERVLQFEEQVLGLEHLVAAYESSIGLIREELSRVEALYVDHLVPVATLSQLRREEVDMEGKLAQTSAEIAKVRGQIAEVRLQIHQVDQELFEEVTGALRDLQEQSAELTERKVAALDQLARLTIRAPATGVVHEVSVHTIGGVIDPGATLMYIVPDTEDLTIEVQVEGQDRDQIHVGQQALLRMTSFDQRTTPELYGTVTTVAADLVDNLQTGARYYPVRITLLPGERERLEGQSLVPGMPVETFVQTSSRTVLSYLLRPLSDYLTRAFRG